MERNKLRLKRKRRIRAKVFGTAQRPRLCVFKSLKIIYAQVIDDERGSTLAAVDSREIKGKAGDKKEIAEKTGAMLAEKCKKIGIQEVVFDRSGYKFHGKIKSLAESAKKGGLKF
ncbi:MAG: 50S ribosomal protein L18 [Candidatus Moranbacteria bacterium RIFCSPHIGHO2_02_FULL_40_12b]|nr:MAG: 50S ribosomal protein L18 [Candidatus Moranbacteria bacterium RIFCSPHIGHO2_02_FULL_40_12b]OGI22933.1 MAG: 50S ribosomal protein L18 [Candidatus Moranbacteria bacterium RIFCSPHIGHO2_12_FULL_40_10]